MKLTNLLCMGVLSALVLTSCLDNDDKSEWNDGSQPITFATSIQGVNTRAADNKWTAGDKVGIFMKAADGDLSAATAANKLHTTDAAGILTAGTAENALYYPSNGSSVDFVAYYPYSSTLANNTYSVNVANQTDQPAIDLLYSNNAKGFAKGTQGKPQLQFAHMLSQIVFNITKDATVPSLDGLTVTFKGMNTKADFTLVDGKLTNVGTVADIAAKVDASKATTIVLPAAALTGVKVVFDLNGKSFTADYPQATLAGGSRYTHNVKLSDSNGQPVIVMDAATITNWTEVPGGDINVDFGDGGTDIPTETTLLDETFNSGMGAFTIVNKKEVPSELANVWFHAVYNSVGYMKASGFKSNVKYETESWLVSPVLDLSKATEAKLTFNHCDKNSAGTRTDEMTLWATDASQENWEQVTILNYGTGLDYNYVSSGEISLSKYAGKTMKFAFKYISTASSAVTWQIQNVKVIANGGTVDPGEPEEPGTDPKPGEEVTLIDEGFGKPVQSGTYWPTIESYTGWDSKAPIVISDPLLSGGRSNATIRATAGMGIDNGHLWLPEAKDCALRFAGISTTKLTNLKLSYTIAANKAGNQNIIVVSTDKGDVVIPSKDITQLNTWQSVEVSLPDGITFVQFTGGAATNKSGYRVDAVKLVGVGK